MKKAEEQNKIYRSHPIDENLYRLKAAYLKTMQRTILEKAEVKTKFTALSQILEVLTNSALNLVLQRVDVFT